VYVGGGGESGTRACAYIEIETVFRLEARRLGVPATWETQQTGFLCTRVLDGGFASFSCNYPVEGSRGHFRDVRFIYTYVRRIYIYTYTSGDLENAVNRRSLFRLRVARTEACIFRVRLWYGHVRRRSPVVQRFGE